MIKKLIKTIQDSQRPPNWYDRIVELEIEIKKGEKFGEVIIPCAVETVSHSIDLNPSLLRKKDRKLIMHANYKEKYNFIEDPSIDKFRVDKEKKTINFNPKHYIIELSEDEKRQKIYLSEIERCEHCGRKEFIAEVKETKYKSCPSIDVTLSDPASEDMKVPVKFGLSTVNMIVWIFNGFISGLLTMFLIGWLMYDFGWILLGITALCSMMSMGPGYRSYKLIQWWVKNRKNMVHLNIEPVWRKIVRCIFTV